MSTRPPHPAATLFPMIAGADLDAMVEDIRRNGLQRPIIVFDGQILDGRNRLAACEAAGVTPRFRVLTECASPTAYVLSANLHRRHLTVIERATIAVSDEVIESLKAEAKARQVAGGAAAGRGRAIGSPRTTGNLSGARTRAERRADEAPMRAARALGVGEGSVMQMAKIKRHSPAIYERAKAGEFKTIPEAIAAAEPKAAPVATPEPKPAETMLGRSARGIDRDRIVALLTKGHKQAEVARMLGVHDSTVSDIARAIARHDPLKRLREAADQTEARFRYMVSDPKEEWKSATPEQIDDLTARVGCAIQAMRAFSKWLNKEARSDQ